MSVGNQIKKRRMELGLTQEALANMMGYKSKSSINKIELDINQITQSKVTRFAEVLHTSPSYIMGWDDSPQENYIYDKIWNIYNNLNDEGKEKVYDYAEDLASSGKYKKHDSYELDKEA